MKPQRRTLAALMAAGALVVGIPAAFATSAPDGTPDANRPAAATGAELADVLAGYTVPDGAEAYTADEWQMIVDSAATFENSVKDPETASVAAVHNTLLETCGFGSTAGRDLLGRLAADDVLYAQRLTSRIAGYIYYALTPLASDDWAAHPFTESVTTTTKDGVTATFAYTMTLPIASPEELPALSFYSIMGENARGLNGIFAYIGDEALSDSSLAVSLLATAVPAMANSRYPGETIEVDFTYEFASEHDATLHPVPGPLVKLEGPSLSEGEVGSFISADAQRELSERFRTILEDEV